MTGVGVILLLWFLAKLKKKTWANLSVSMSCSRLRGGDDGLDTAHTDLLWFRMSTMSQVQCLGFFLIRPIATTPPRCTSGWTEGWQRIWVVSDTLPALGGEYRFSISDIDWHQKSDSKCNNPEWSSENPHPDSVKCSIWMQNREFVFKINNFQS